MDHIEPYLRSRYAAKMAVCTFLLTFPFVFASTVPAAVTKSFGEPYHGRLAGGVPFPAQFSGYQLRDSGNIYATPELVGALLDAIEGVRRNYPDTCSLYLGDFSSPTGGPLRNHASHQNGRDVDIGMYAKDNVRLDGSQLMSGDNLDVAKTWCLIENLLKTDRVQYMFMDKRLQSIFFEYALRHGWNRESLDIVFNNVGQSYDNSIIRHSRGHRDHIHVRFYAPWSALAAASGGSDTKKLATIALAQAAYLPKKVKFTIKGRETALTQLAQSFGVSTDDLCRWNGIRPTSRPRAGSCLVYYKRGFELEPVNLAQSLPAPTRPSSDLVRLASIEPSAALSDAELSPRDQAQSPAQPLYYRVKSSDNLTKIAQRYHLTVDQLCRLNGISKKTKITAGKSLKVGIRKTAAAPASGRVQTATHTVAKGDTLNHLADRYHLTVEQLSALNDLDRKDALKPGRELKLKTSAKAAPEPSKTAHVVKSGDTLYAIASKYGISVDDLGKANHMKGTALRQGQELTIPAAASAPAKTDAEKPAATAAKSKATQTPTKSKAVAAKARPQAEIAKSKTTAAAAKPVAAKVKPKTEAAKSKSAAVTPKSKTEIAKSKTTAAAAKPKVKPKAEAAKSKSTDSAARSKSAVVTPKSKAEVVKPAAAAAKSKPRV